MRHVKAISRTPQMAQQTTSDLTFLLAILELVGSLFGTFLTSFLGVFSGVLDALGTYNDLKNPSTT
ncbi:MAG: hypothetical protein HUU46_02610 [Candidatus Hydrogenedentes bacterium]|nr:hypothetical protein [Candidatus Hydrogenedentota bacterium]